MFTNFNLFYYSNILYKYTKTAQTLVFWRNKYEYDIIVGSKTSLN